MREDAAGPGRRRLALVAAGYGVAAAAATLASSPGQVVADNRYDQFVDPAGRWGASLWAWDGARGLGRVREDLWPGPTLPLAALRAVGAPPWVAERLWHALLLWALAFGTVLVVRLVRPQVGWASPTWWREPRPGSVPTAPRSWCRPTSSPTSRWRRGSP
jgi:hypothetical protein